MKDRLLQVARWAGLDERPLGRLHGLLIAVWSLEVFVVQALTLKPNLWQNAFVPYKHQGLRVLAVTAFVALLVAALRYRYLVALWVVQLALSATLIAYFSYFSRPLSLLTVMNQMKEGAEVSSAGVAMLRAQDAWLLVALALKLFVGYRAERDPHPSPVGRRKLARALVPVWIVAVLLGHWDKPLSRIATWETTGGLGFVHGYGVTWAAEFMYVKHEALLEHALERGKFLRDRLTPVEAPFPLRDHLVFLQVESLDYDVVGFRVGGREVTPRLAVLRDQAMYYRVQAQKIVGSCDTDFTVLMGRLGSTEVPTYRIEEYPYDTALPRLLRGRGFTTSIMHGVSGDFFARHGAFRKMGFGELQFKEDLVVSRKLDPTPWTLSDGDVLRAGVDWMKSRPGPHFQMVITATSHMPYRYITNEQAAFFPEEDGKEWAYFDSIHYVDEVIGQYLDALPPRTTVVMYGDHWSRVQNLELGYDPVLIEEQGLVPFWVWNTGENLGETSRVKGKPLQTSGELTLLDMVTWVHHHVRASLGARHAGL